MEEPFLLTLTSDASADLAPGTRLGKYEVVRRLSVGGMAEVFLARKLGVPGFQVNVALKRILPQLANQKDLVAMFLDEARLAATLQHPHIVQIHDVCGENDSYFIAMEYLHGEDVSAILRAAFELGRRISLEHVLSIMSALLSALHYAHEKEDDLGQPLHIVHRDVSPSNVIVTYEGGVKLVDFGIATAAMRAAEQQSGVVQGKLGYMSPEQARGDACDRRTDVYAAGVILYELATGQKLFRGKNDFDLIARVMKGDFDRPRKLDPSFDPALELIIMGALQADRSNRYPTAHAMQQELEAFARQRGLFMSPTALKSFMGELFAKKIADEQRVRRFTDRGFVPIPAVAATAPPARAPDPAAPTAPLTPDPSGEAITPRPPPRRLSRLGVLAVGASALGLVGLLTLHRQSPRTAAASITAPAPLPAAAPAPAPAPSPPRPAAAETFAPDEVPAKEAPVEKRSRGVATTTPSRHDRARTTHAEAKPPVGKGGFGALTLSANPGCAVTIDGKARGQTPLTLSLPAGNHKIVLSSPEHHLKRQLTIAVKAGEVVRKALDFSEWL